MTTWRFPIRSLAIAVVMLLVMVLAVSLEYLLPWVSDGDAPEAGQDCRCDHRLSSGEKPLTVEDREWEQLRHDLLQMLREEIRLKLEINRDAEALRKQLMRGFEALDQDIEVWRREFEVGGE